MISIAAALVGRRRLAQALAAIALGALTVLSTAPSRAQEITIGEGIALGWGQFFVADHDKTWEKQGLVPKVSTFASGRLVLDALVGGGVLIGTAAETPVVFATLNGLPVRVIGTLNRHEPFDLVAIKDIKSAKDIKGRRIGYSQGTNAHYYLFKLLQQQGLSWSDITAVSLNPGDFASSLSGGAIDAFIWTEPHLSQAIAQGKDRFHIIRSEGLYNTYSAIITLQSTIDNKPELLVKALKALIEADDNIRKNPEAAATLTAERIKLDPAIAKSFWKRANFKLELDKPALVSLLQEQAKWAVDSKLVRPDAKIPDFSTVVVTSLLDQARKE
ncbi:NrtA/SsuA/CpmA family ABC transporter substrate-binding protein [Bradyrhizobium sp. Arg237L]|uniref:ABC transporter substrate-binding protein n=1 Tax=Bradyrhizobium sp. Arg237L TaxID=3003352 RepID=UPI00249F94F0|nr:NrtA/SsuA/CpmA family ABC transporter substrate-binding protein [Bradyrhizobium sp. Arg237L]MDI4234086.1 NrtA/SsuA/CpmA family ABC transporter substrate-binding protein [Bradyrhizobium sp. Arg237L]